MPGGAVRCSRALDRRSPGYHANERSCVLGELKRSVYAIPQRPWPECRDRRTPQRASSASERAAPKSHSSASDVQARRAQARRVPPQVPTRPPSPACGCWAAGSHFTPSRTPFDRARHCDQDTERRSQETRALLHSSSSDACLTSAHHPRPLSVSTRLVRSRPQSGAAAC